jgi:hypothetical protein
VPVSTNTRRGLCSRRTLSSRQSANRTSVRQQCRQRCKSAVGYDQVKHEAEHCGPSQGRAPHRRHDRHAAHPAVPLRRCVRVLCAPVRDSARMCATHLRATHSGSMPGSTSVVHARLPAHVPQCDSRRSLRAHVPARHIAEARAASTCRCPARPQQTATRSKLCFVLLSFKRTVARRAGGLKFALAMPIAQT